MIATGKSALFVNVTTTLIHQKYKTSSVCEPDNWEFNSKVKVAIMNYIDCYKPEYIILYCNQPNLSMRALNPDEFNILLSEISSELLKAICSQPTQRAYPNVISFCAKPGHPWVFPNTGYFEHCVYRYNLDPNTCAILGGSTMDTKLKANTDIKIYYDQQKFTELDFAGKFTRNETNKF